MVTSTNTIPGIPAIPDAPTDDAALKAQLDAMKEAIEVLTGARGSPYSRALTWGEATENGQTDLFITNRVVETAIAAPVSTRLSGDIEGTGLWGSTGSDGDGTVVVPTNITLPNIILLQGGASDTTFTGAAAGPYGIEGAPEGGTDGQVLTKLSSTDGDYTWETAAGGGGGDTVTYGVWTPVISDGTNDTTMVNQDGMYAEIGNLVYISCHCSFSSAGSASGAARITGLPYTAYDLSAGLDFPLTVGQAASHATSANNSVVVAQVENNAAYITLHVWDDGGGADTNAMTIAQVSNSGILRISGWYRKA